LTIDESLDDFEKCKFLMLKSNITQVLAVIPILINNLDFDKYSETAPRQPIMIWERNPPKVACKPLIFLTVKDNLNYWHDDNIHLEAAVSLYQIL